MPQTIVDRPVFPADYGVPGADTGMLPYSHATERLKHALIYWVNTVRPNGRPHSSPIWAVWVDDTLYFDGSPETRRGQNIAVNPAVAIHIESGGAGKDVLMLEGDVEALRGVDLPNELKERIAAEYTAKYVADGYSPGPDQWDAGGLYAVRVRTMIAWTTFNIDPTRWRFSE